MLLVCILSLECELFTLAASESMLLLIGLLVWLVATVESGLAVGKHISEYISHGVMVSTHLRLLMSTHLRSLLSDSPQTLRVVD